MTLRPRTLALALALVLTLAAGAAFATLHFGLYNISATRQHTAPVYWLMEYAMQRSMRTHSPRDEPRDLAEPRRIRAGAAHFAGHCVQCHGAPGVAPQPFAHGMTPAPANLMAVARDWEPGQIFWVVKHGIKMTGMPAWEFQLTDEDIWDIAAFVKAMAAMSPADYAQLSREVPAHTHRQGHAEAADAGPSRAPEVLGDPQAGRRAAAQHLCATCHVIPGILGSNNHVGPPLAGMARRQYIAGVLRNTPENMVLWLRRTQEVAPQSAMPDMGLSEADARDIAAFMYTLREAK